MWSRAFVLYICTHKKSDVQIVRRYSLAWVSFLSVSVLYAPKRKSFWRKRFLGLLRVSA